jgi:hypothetical protein
MSLVRPVARVHSIRKARASALFRHGILVLSAVVMAMGLAATARADQLTWIVQSDYKYQVELEFFSRSPRTVWPGHGNAYPLDDSDAHAITISCQHGQYICYGAWPTGRDDLIWGAGRDGKEACHGCCYVCGNGDAHVSIGN